jgi:hypothetical protein
MTIEEERRQQQAQRAHLVSTIELALAIMSGADVELTLAIMSGADGPVFVSPPSQSLTTLLREGLNPPGSSMPRMQPVARMSRHEQRAHLLSTIELALATMSGADATVFVSPLFSTSSENDEDDVRAPQ